MEIRRLFAMAATLTITVVLATASAEAGSEASKIDPAKIAQILGQETMSAQKASTQDRSLLNSFANAQTKSLGQGNKEWVASNPKWALIYKHIRADLVAEVPRADAAAASTFEEDIASQLHQSDVDKILAYYSTSEGKRYQVFMHRIEPILISGMAGLVRPGSAQLSGSRPTAEQSRRYYRALLLSRTIQSMTAKMEADKAAHRDTSGYQVVAFFIDAAIGRNQAELEKIDQEYVGDLPGFEAFSRSDPAKHLFLAMATASAKRLEQERPIVIALQAAAQKHRSDWKAMYQKVIVK